MRADLPALLVKITHSPSSSPDMVEAAMLCMWSLSGTPSYRQQLLVQMTPGSLESLMDLSLQLLEHCDADYTHVVIAVGAPPGLSSVQLACQV